MPQNHHRSSHTPLSGTQPQTDDEPGPNGKPRHVSAFYRYATRGVLGIRLKTWRFPDGLYTTIAAWYEFIEQLTAAVNGDHHEKKTTTPRASTKRQNLIEAEIDEVRASIGRKTIRKSDSLDDTEAAVPAGQCQRQSSSGPAQGGKT